MPAAVGFPSRPHRDRDRMTPDTNKAEQPGSLRKLAIRGSIWTVLGFGGNQVLRFGSNLVMARLLVPEVFGVMAFLRSVMTGLQMMSDVGAGPAIVRDRRGEDPAYLNTAWVMQITRGLVASTVMWILARPIAEWFERPELTKFIPIVGFMAAVSGFNSTSLHTARRNMAANKLVIVELVSQILCVIVMIVWAVVSPSIWALIAGGFTRRITRLALSHTYLATHRNKLQWDREAFRSLFSFGKWIFLSSLLFYIADNGDRLLIMKYIGPSMLGVYYFALNICTPLSIINQRLSRQILLPAMGRIQRESPERIANVFYRARFVTDLTFLVLIGFLIQGGQLVIDLLYDARYEQAGWMLCILSIRSAARCILEPCEQCVIAVGLPRSVTWTHVLRTSWIFVGLPLGWYLGGIQGLVWAVALSETLPLLFLWWTLGTQGILRPLRELRALALIAAGAALGFAVQHLAGGVAS